uniref:Uncharacterized protein n=1 Tax=Arundo donax TaxID=35708 RepID=A0A0A9BSZ3_ARUDO
MLIPIRCNSFRFGVIRRIWLFHFSSFFLRCGCLVLGGRRTG